jgi:hypothetical protein
VILYCFVISQSSKPSLNVNNILSLLKYITLHFTEILLQEWNRTSSYSTWLSGIAQPIRLLPTYLRPVFETRWISELFSTITSGPTLAPTHLHMQWVLQIFLQDKTARTWRCQHSKYIVNFEAFMHWVSIYLYLTAIKVSYLSFHRKNLSQRISIISGDVLTSFSSSVALKSFKELCRLKLRRSLNLFRHLVGLRRASV